LIVFKSWLYAGLLIFSRGSEDRYRTPRFWFPHRNWHSFWV